jgi:hypothetical protein
MTTAQRRPSTFFLLIAILFLAMTGHGQQRPCADVEGRRALDKANTLRSWDALHRSYSLYRQCDDGAIGEGYSESVARILVDHWTTLPQLARAAENDIGFRAFVMKHVDATLNTDDLAKIRKNAQTQCPKGLRAVCNDLTNQADSALRERPSS